MEQLLNDVRRGDNGARTQLYRILQKDERVQRTIRSLSYERSCVESDDIEGEFWRGIIKGMAVVRHDVGDPILHLVQRGVWQVKSVVKEELHRRIVQQCGRCGHENLRYSYNRVCEHCGVSVENQTRAVDLSDFDFTDEFLSSISTVAAVEVKYPVSASQLRILEILIQCCIARSRNPSTDCARILGISKQRVHQQILKLRPSIVLTD